MSHLGDLDSAAGTRPAFGPAAVSVQRPHDRRDSWLRTGPDGDNTLPLAGQPGHGRTAFVRRQPVRIVDGRFEGGRTDVFELICPACGDHPYLDYSEVPSRIQWLRGPRTLEAALVAYHKHLGLLPQPAGTEPEASAPGNAKAGSAAVPR